VIVLDAGVLVGVLAPEDPFHRAATAAMRERHADRMLLPMTAYAEARVGPLRAGDEAVERYEGFLRRRDIRLAAVDRSVAQTAAGLRVRHGSRLRLPDALVIATAEVVGADEVLTTDHSWPDTGMHVTVLQP
jgi:predicted nucleic acid-binding protein